MTHNSEDMNALLRGMSEIQHKAVAVLVMNDYCPVHE